MGEDKDLLRACAGVKCAVQGVDSVFCGLHNSNERIPIETVLTVALLVAALHFRSKKQSKQEAQVRTLAAEVQCLCLS